jgi:hypothetical protein
MQPDGDLQQCAELYFSLTGRKGGGSSKSIYYLRGHGVTAFENCSLMKKEF